MGRHVFPSLVRGPLESCDRVFDLPNESDDESADAYVRLQQEIDDHVVRHASGFAFVHSGVIGVGDAAALLIAPSGHGKSSIVEELVARARVDPPVDQCADYYSDEYAAIDARGWVHPYPRSLLVRRGNPTQRPVTPHELGARVATAPAQVRLVLEAPHSAEETTPLRITPLDQGAALQLLLKNTPQPIEDFPGIFGPFTKVAGQARSYSGIRGEAPVAARAILDLLSG